MKQIINLIIIAIIINIILKLLKNNNKKNNIMYNLLKDKIKNISFISQINYYIIELKNLKISSKNFLNILFILILSSLISILTFYVSYIYFNIISTSLILSIISFFIPINLIKKIYVKQKEKILEVFPMYCIYLKNYTNSTNDIVLAMKKIETDYPLNIFIHKFNLSIEKGIRVYDAFEDLKKKINIKIINNFVTLLQYAYINGSNFSRLLDKYANILVKTNIQKEKEKEELLSSKIVIYVLMIINAYIIHSFVFLNEEYRNVIVNSAIGKLIININIISYFMIFLLMKKNLKMEEYR